MSRIHIKNGTVFDGTGGASFVGDLVVEDGRIREVSHRPLEVSDADIVDASGKWVKCWWHRSSANPCVTV